MAFSWKKNTGWNALLCDYYYDPCCFPNKPAYYQ